MNISSSKICRNLNLDYKNFRVGDHIRVPHYCFISPLEDHDIRSVTYKVGSGEASVEDILSRLTPMDMSIDQLRRYVRDDFRVGFGVDCPDLKVVTIEAKFPEMFPIVCYQLNDAGRMEYFAHPQIHLMVQRYV